MNPNFKTLVIFCLQVAVLSSCYDDLDMVYTHQSDNVVVIEAKLTDAFEPFVVLLSKSTSMDDTANYQEIDSAQVFLSDNSGWKTQLKKTSKGRYESENMRGKVGQVYKLEVLVDGKLYYAIEEIHPCEIFDSLSVVSVTNSIIYADGLYAMAKITIPPEDISYYRAVVSKNDSIFSGYNDLLIFETSFLKDETEVMLPYPFISGDRVVVYAYSISEGMYEYFSAYARITQGSLSPSSLPVQNPPTNLIGGAVGYFQVSSITVDSIQIQ